jgi:hypothetical protein
MSFYDNQSRRNYSRRRNGIDELYAAVMLVAVFACGVVLDVCLYKADLYNARTSAYFVFNESKIQLLFASLFLLATYVTADRLHCSYLYVRKLFVNRSSALVVLIPSVLCKKKLARP